MIRFGTIAKLLAAPLAFVMLTGLYHRGTQLTIEFPDGWAAPTQTGNDITQVANTAAGVLCNAQTNFMPSLKDLRLDELNAEYNKPFTAAQWGEFLSIPADEISIREGERRPFGDAFFQIATLDVKPGTFASIATVIRFGVYILPGRVTMGACYANAASYPQWQATFDKTVSSLRPW